MIDISDIEKQPLTTNKIKVDVNMEKFFSMYSVVSYYSLDKEYKNMAYEQLSDAHCLSVTGIRARWSKSGYPFVKFFILVEKDKVLDVVSSLRLHDQVRFQYDSLSDYDNCLQKRILASLAINSLGKVKNGKMMYNDGSLLLCDDKNFLVPASRKELVCVKVEINEYMNLIAKTTSFSTPKSIEQLRKHGNCVFQVSKDVHGQWWSGQAVKPVVVRKLKDSEIKLDEFYIKKKKFSDRHNIVPYWPYNPENYTHGKLYALSQVVESVNNKFKDILSVGFEDFPIEHFDQQQTKKEMETSLLEYFNGKSISFEDPFDTKESSELIANIKTEFCNIIGETIHFPKKRMQNDMLIKLVEPKEEDAPTTHYTQSLYRLGNPALQHKEFYTNKENKISTSEARRILIELLVKDSLINRRMTPSLSNMIQGWNFIRYKINQGNVYGASLSVDKDCKINITDYGFSNRTMPYDFESFACDELHFEECERINGAQDYMALKKDGNVYLIVSTDEIPILDVSLLDEEYPQIAEDLKPLSFFKRKGEAHKYLRGYVGFHLWRTDGLEGEPKASFSYIVGTNNDSLKITKATLMDKMPRARRVFVLHKERPELIQSQIMSICDMLKLGFGRWNEMMTYPFPFKFLQEYLDDATETAYSKHWSEITCKGDL